MSASWACSGLLAALLLAACGDGPSLSASGFAPGRGMTDVPDRRTGGSAEPVPTWRVEGGEVSFSVLLRNRGSRIYMVIGVERDEDGDDRQFDPEGIDGAVEIWPGSEFRVEVRGRAVCRDMLPGQLSTKNSQRFTLGDGTARDVDLGALIEFACKR